MHKHLKTLICKIPPNLPLLKGGITPLWQRGARGDFLMTMSIQFWDLLYVHSSAMSATIPCAIAPITA